MGLKDLDFSGLTDSQMDDLLACAFEGGANYWYMIEKFEKPRQGNLYYLGRDMTVTNEKGFEGREGKFKTIVTKEVCDNTLKMIETKYVNLYECIINGNYDAADADTFLQLCVMREIIYG